MFKINDYITKENYTAGAIWCNQNNAMIAVLKEGGRVRYQIQAVSAAPEQNYAEQRALAYPVEVEQLDMLYHDIDDGLLGVAAKESRFYLARKAVKEEYLKGGK